ncbi:MAG: DUF1273 family protein [Ruminococcaceae bacterium]|nr:DUF1273 family protein [Oscillospiraceae bacterium]
MIKKKCCFAGHKDTSCGSIKQKLQDTLIKLIENENVQYFWIGNYGAFDKCAATVIKSLKKEYPDIKSELIIPYLTKDIINNGDYYKNYDSILIAEIPPNTPQKFRISKANEYMVKKCDYIVCYVDHTYGGAYQTLKSAQKKNIKIINLCDKEIKL